MTRISRAKAIKLHCIECSGYEKSEVKKCGILTCPLWPYRMGKEVAVDPKITANCKEIDTRKANRKPLTPEQKASLLERLARGRKSK
jgi:hypothetical protein